MLSEQILKTSELTKSFGNLIAVNNVEMEINRGEIVGLIGPNGAGKTTFFNLVTGLEVPDKGQVVFKGVNIVSMPPQRQYIYSEICAFTANLFFSNRIFILYYVIGIIVIM
jgi:ABC-type branched-subunit amino acid transport system ATPase component